MKPIFLVTLHRRYFELEKNITNLRKLCLEELNLVPEIILIWSQPEIGMIHFVEKMKFTKVVGRPKLLGEDDKSTTYPESINLRFGLKYISEHFPAYSTIICMAADISINPGTLNFIKSKIDDGNRAIVFHWPNGFVQQGIWHTNFFVVPPIEDYWPPKSFSGDQDVLEWKWGKELAEKAFPDVYRWHNYNDRIFKHAHESEDHPISPQGFILDNGVNLFIKSKRDWRKLWLK